MLIQPGNTKELTSRLKQLLGDKALRTKMGHNAREAFLQNYTLENFYDGLTDIFNEVLHEKTGKVRKLEKWVRSMKSVKSESE
jgi:glycosyltransferase involved in cell wall biosynthesis